MDAQQVRDAILSNMGGMGDAISHSEAMEDNGEDGPGRFRKRRQASITDYYSAGSTASIAAENSSCAGAEEPYQKRLRHQRRPDQDLRDRLCGATGFNEEEEEDVLTAITKNIDEVVEEIREKKEMMRQLGDPEGIDGKLLQQEIDRLSEQLPRTAKEVVSRSQLRSIRQRCVSGPSASEAACVSKGDAGAGIGEFLQTGKDESGKAVALNNLLINHCEDTGFRQLAVQLGRAAVHIQKSRGDDSDDSPMTVGEQVRAGVAAESFMDWMRTDCVDPKVVATWEIREHRKMLRVLARATTQRPNPAGGKIAVPQRCKDYQTISQSMFRWTSLLHTMQVSQRANT